MMSKQTSRAKITIVAAIICAVVLLPSAACRADNVAEARAAFEEGIAHFQEDRYALALAAFETSYRMRQTAIVLFNIGMCQKALSRYAESLASFQVLLNTETFEVSPEVRRDAESAIRDIEENAGKLQLENLPEAAALRIDGHAIARALMGNPIFIAAGQHTATLTKVGFKSRDIAFSVVPGQVVTLDGSMEEEAAVLQIDCPAAATVHIDNVEAGSCPFEGKVAPGAVEVMVTAPGKERVVRTLIAQPGGTSSLAIRLDAETPSPQHHDVTVTKAAPVDADSRKKSQRLLLLGGIASAASGIAGLGIGVGFSARYNREYNDVRKTIGEVNRAFEEGNRDEYDSLAPLAAEKSTDLQDKKYPRYRKGMIAGYTAGGILTATGAVLLLLYGVRGRQKERDVAVTPTLGGVDIAF